jgi:hypothetical protein
MKSNINLEFCYLFLPLTPLKICRRESEPPTQIKPWGVHFTTTDKFFIYNIISILFKGKRGSRRRVERREGGDWGEWGYIKNPLNTKKLSTPYTPFCTNRI